MHSNPSSVDGCRAVGSARRSVHVEPIGSLQIARHHIRELIYGANDSIVTPFGYFLSGAPTFYAVVAGVAGGGLLLRVVLVISAANLFADRLLSSNAVTLLAMFAVGTCALGFARSRRRPRT